MAKSPSHQFGQIIGNALELAIEPILVKFVRHHKLYLDKMGERPCRSGKKVTWKDSFGNSHDLDFVIERGGSKNKTGTPIAFIETAWRRYTKHSRNKAQEVQGAILPLVSTYKNSSPFMGAVLAGVFTGDSLTQLKSLGFNILYIPYETVTAAFSKIGIDATFNEKTPDRIFKSKIKLWNALSNKQKSSVSKAIISMKTDQAKKFFENLENAVLRQIELIRILPLHGRSVDYREIDAAIAFIEKYNQDLDPLPLVKYEIEIRYNNHDKIQAEFSQKTTAIQFLSNYKY